MIVCSHVTPAKGGRLPQNLGRLLRTGGCGCILLPILRRTCPGRRTLWPVWPPFAILQTEVPWPDLPRLEAVWCPWSDTRRRSTENRNDDHGTSHNQYISSLPDHCSV